MTYKCPSCGSDVPDGQPCPRCSQGDRSVIDRVSHKTGEAIEKGVEVTEKAVQELKPVAREIAHTGKRGIKKLKDASLTVAKDLKRKSEQQ